MVRSRRTINAPPSRLPELTELLGAPLHTGGRKSNHWLSWSRCSLLVGERTYHEARNTGTPVAAMGLRRRITSELLDSPPASSFELPDVHTGSVSVVAGVAFSSVHIRALKMMGETVMYVSTSHMRTSPVGGSFILAVGADASIMEVLDGWEPCPNCRGRGRVKVGG